METDTPTTTNNQNNNMEDECNSSVFERSVNSKFSDWTSVFDSKAELSAYKFCWSPNESPGSKSPHRSRDSLLSESVVFEKIVKARDQLHQIFDETCTALFNDIQLAFESWDIGQEVYLNDLLEREALIRAHAEQLAELAPEMSELISLKLTSLSRSLEQLRLKHETDVKMGYSDRSATNHLRKWLQKTEFKLEQIKEDIGLATEDSIELQRIRASLQVVQLGIESEGKQLIQTAKRYLSRKSFEWTTDSARIQRLKRNFEVLETRWYNLYLAGVEALEQITGFIDRLASSGDENSDVESIGSLEPLRKRRRRSLDDPFIADLGQKSVRIQNSLRAESETDEDDTIPFSASEYESIMPTDNQASDVEYENHRGQLVANRSAMVSTDDSVLDKTPTGLQHRTSSAEDGWSSSGKTHDVGYSSGENSVHEALNSIGSESPNPTEATQTDSIDLQRMRTQNSPVNSYYRTVPLDDCGITDTETPRFVPSLKLVVEDSDNGNQVLSESMVVHAGDNSDDSTTLDKDYKEVMKLMDDQMASAKSMMGTSWKELKSANSRRLSATPSKWNSVGKMQNNRRSLPTATGKMSCDASSEDSDYATNNSILPTQLSVSFNGRASNLLTVPSNAHSQPQMMQRKRRHQRQTPNSASKMTTSLNNSILKNLQMEQSVYEPMMCDEEDLMSQSLNLPEKNARKRLVRRRCMRRTASDNTDLNFHIGNLTAQVPQLNDKNYAVERRNSMDSNSSSTTFHDSGDAHFEWDEYREEPLIEDVPMAPNTDLSMNGLTKHPKHPHSVMPILASPDVDDDFQTELPFVDVHDNMGIHAFLSQSKDSLDESYRLLQSQKGSDEALRLNAISVGRIAIENLRRIRSIMRSSAILDMKCLEEFDKLHNEWLELIGTHKIPADDTLSADEVSEVMTLFRKIREYYLIFGQTFNQSDNEFISNASVDELKTRLNLRKESFIELQKLHEKMARTVRQFSELQPDLDRVSANINILSRSVANLECFYQIGDIRETMKNLYKRLDDVTAAVNRLSKNGSQISDHKNVDNKLRRIDSDLNDCQNRMSSLETSCNNIIAWMNKKNGDSGYNADEDEIECMNKIIEQFGETKNEVSSMRSRFDDLMKTHYPNFHDRPSSQLNEDSYSDSSVSKFSTSELKLRRPRRVSHDESVDLQTSSTSNEKLNTAQPKDLTANNNDTSTTQYNSTVRTLFSCLILMGFGLFLLFLASDGEVFGRSGHWRFKFGPQLRYVNGAPPS